MRTLWTPLVIAAPLAFASFASTARAEDAPRARLTYRVPDDASCPNERGFRDMVASRVGRDPFADDATQKIEASVSPKPDSAELHGRVALIDADGEVRGERELDDRSCTTLVESLTVAISILLDPFGRWSAHEPPLAQSPPPVPVSTSVEAARPLTRGEGAAPLPPAAPRRDVDWMPMAGVATSVGNAPGALFGGRLGLRRAARSWSLAAEAGFDTTLEEARIGSDRVEAQRWLWGLTPCFHPWSLSVCVPAGIGIFNGSSSSVVAPTTRRTLFADLGLRVGWSFWFGRNLGIEPWIAGSAPLIRTTLLVSDQAVWRAPWIAGALGASVLVQGL